MIILTKFHKGRRKIVDFSLIAKFWACLLFFHPPSKYLIYHLFLQEKSKIIDGGCTVPGCHYPKIFHRNVGKLRNKSLISCQLQDLGLPSHHVECSLKCRQGWSPSNGINSTICNQEIGGGGIQQKKLTNFTVDYLECSRLVF